MMLVTGYSKSLTTGFVIEILPTTVYLWQKTIIVSRHLFGKAWLRQLLYNNQMKNLALGR